MLGRLYARAQMRADMLQLRCQQAESRALKAEWVADQAIAQLARLDREAAAVIEMEAAV
jgi:primosomal protein N''